MAAQEWPSFADAYAALYIHLNLTHVVQCRRVNSDNRIHQQPSVVSCGQRAAILHGRSVSVTAVTSVLS